MELILNTLDILTSLVTIIGLPLALYSFRRQKQKDKEFEEEKTFHQLDESYVSFLQLAIQHPDLDIFDPPIGKNYSPTDEQLRREHAIFGILISLFERSFLMFKDQSEKYKDSQWSGWVEFIKSYSYRENFKSVWNKIGHQFDSEFCKFMDHLINENSEEILV